jgi:uncharacterized protein YjeT (DUF2065 family)
MSNSIIDLLVFAVVLAVGIYFIALGLASLLAPTLAKRFLRGFATSPLAHYTELFTRLIVGGAFLVQSPRMQFSAVFEAFGWILIGTTACLLLVPWRWHHRFAQRSVAAAIRYIALIGVCSLAIGGLLLFALIHSATA